jgi:hypothetical protein
MNRDPVMASAAKPSSPAVIEGFPASAVEAPTWIASLAMTAVQSDRYAL